MLATAKLGIGRASPHVNLAVPIGLTSVAHQDISHRPSAAGH